MWCMVVINIWIYQIAILEQCNSISVKGPLLFSYQTSCPPLPGKKIIVVCLIWIHATFEDVQEVLNAEIYNVGVIDGILWENPASTTYLLHKIQGGRRKFHLKYIYDMWWIKAHVNHTARGTEHIDINVIRMFWIEEELSIPTLFNFGNFSMNNYHFTLIDVIIRINIIYYLRLKIHNPPANVWISTS